MEFLFSDVFRSKLLEELYRSPWNQMPAPSFVALHCLECVILTKGSEWCFSKSKGLGHFGSCSNLKSERRACDTVVIQSHPGLHTPLPISLGILMSIQC